MKTFVFTCGDPNGIGPEIVIKTLNKVCNKKDQFIFVCPPKIFLRNADVIAPTFPFRIVRKIEKNNQESGTVRLLSLAGSGVSPGRPTKQSGKISFEALKKGIELTTTGTADALITAPLSKEAWNLHGVKYKGHTDFLADVCGVKNHVMMFHSAKMIAALLTIHTPIKDVPKLITRQRITDIICAVKSSLRSDLGYDNPSIAVLGLNPHAGEKGYIGKEETSIIAPVIRKLRKENIHGPFVPDAFFANKLYKNYNAVLGMYHDEVLIPFKMLNFETGVNYTAGLPIVRTSPDHGTAYDIAYTGKANPSSMVRSFRLAKKIITNRNNHKAG